MSLPLLPLTRAQGARIRALIRDKKVRAEEGAFVIEGPKSCLDVIRHHPESILSLTLSSRYLRDETPGERAVRSRLAVRQYSCSDDLFAKLSDVETPQGVLAVLRRPRWDESRVLGQSRVLGLYGDQLRDPANVGTIVRTLAALNLTGLWLSTDSVDCFSPKVVRATAASLLSLPVFYTREIRTFREQSCSIYSAVIPSTEAISLRNIRDAPRRLIVAVGNEGQGLSAGILKASSLKFCIPLARQVESLNVAATVAIAAFYFSGLPQAAEPPRR